MSISNTKVNPSNLTDSERNTLLANGYPWLPGHNKAVYLDGWQKLEVTTDMMEWLASETPDWSNWRNTGLQLGRVIIAADNDIIEKDLAAKVQTHIENALGTSTCIRIGSKGQAALYRVNESFRSIVVRGVAPGETKRRTAVEFLGLERQLMAFGDVDADPAKGQADFTYKWPEKSPLDTPVSDLPLAMEGDVLAAATAIRDELAKAGWTELRVTQSATEADKDSAHKETKKSNGGLMSQKMLRTMLSYIDPGIGRKESSSWISVLGALKHAEACELVCLPDSFEPDPEFDAETAAIEWSRGDYWKDGQPSNFDGEADVAKTLSTLNPFAPRGSTIATIVSIARDGGYKGPTRIDTLMDLYFHEVDSNEQVPSVYAEDLYDPWQEDYVPPFPLNALPPKVRRFAEETSLQMGADPAAVAMASIAVLTGAITHEAKLVLSNTFRPSPCLWILLAGDSGTQKTPILDAARAPLVELSASYMAAHERHLIGLELDGATDKDLKRESAKPVSRPIIGNVSVEKVADILAGQDSGVLLYHDELSGWIGSFDKYSNGSGADRAFWLTARNGGYYTLDRKVSGSAHVKNLSVSILGGIQTERLRELGNLMSDGLMQRFIPTIMRKPRRGVKMDTSDAIAGWKSLVTKLSRNKSPFNVRLSKEAEAEFDRFRDFVFELKANQSAGAHFRSFLMKLEGIWGNVALNLHVAWEEITGVDGVLSGENAKRATRIILDFILPHAFVFYRSMVSDTRGEDQAIGACIQKILVSGRTTIKTRELQHGTSCLKSVKSVAMADRLVPFTAGGWLLPEKEGPWCSEWRINPKVEQFAANAEKHRNDWKALQDQWKAAGKRETVAS